MPKGDGYGGAPAARWVAIVLKRDGDLCHLCRHVGADSADHIVPRVELVARGQLDRLYDPTNGKPVHHKPCPVCGVRCNSRRKAKPLDALPAVDAVRFFDTGA